MNAPAPADEEHRQRAELSAFLKAMRERLKPEDVGLPRGSRRRTPGLRREEVAVRAAMSTTWYTWLEQGRAVTASLHALESLAVALNLTPVERTHLFRLARPYAPVRHRTGPAAEPSAQLSAFVDGLAPHPAYVLGPMWDLMAWNTPAAVLLGFDAEAGRWSLNLLSRMFLDEGWKALFENWEQLASTVVAQFRASTADLRSYPEFRELVQTLESASSEFARLWSRVDVEESRSRRKALDHPQAGRMVFNYSTLACEGADRGCWLSIYTPESEVDQRALAGLVANREPTTK